MYVHDWPYVGNFAHVRTLAHALCTLPRASFVFDMALIFKAMQRADRCVSCDAEKTSARACFSAKVDKFFLLLYFRHFFFSLITSFLRTFLKVITSVSYELFAINMVEL